MYSTYFEPPQCHDAQPALSPTQKAAAFDQIQHMLANLASPSYEEPDPRKPDICEAHADKHQLHDAASRPACERSPCTPTKSTVYLNTDGYTELDASAAQHSPLTPSTTVSSHALWTRDASEPADPLTWEELTHLAHLKTAMRESAQVLIQARRVVEIETEKLNRLDAEYAAVQCGRQGKGNGGTYNRANNRNHADTSTAAGQTPQSGDVNVPAFMAQYLPCPDATLFPPIDPPGTKRCTVGRPLGKVLRPSDGRFYTIGRCDKHEDEKVFNDNMHVHVSREGGYKERDHAWKCSGEATRGPRREANRAL